MKWKKLRDSYRDALKRQSEMLAKEPANPAKKNYPWKYMGLMQFLQPHMSVRKKPAEGGSAPTGGGLMPSSAGLPPPTNGDAHSSDESDSEPDSTALRKSADRLSVIDRKLDYLCKVQTAQVHAAKRPCFDSDAHGSERKRDCPDPLDIFFNSMCQSTKRLPYPTQIRIKKTVFSAVIEAEEALVAEQQSYASLWARGAASPSSSEPPADAEEDDRKPS